MTKVEGIFKIILWESSAYFYWTALELWRINVKYILRTHTGTGTGIQVQRWNRTLLNSVILYRGNTRSQSQVLQEGKTGSRWRLPLTLTPNRLITKTDLSTQRNPREETAKRIAGT